MENLRLMGRGRGGIGMVTSTAGTQGAVNFATYNSGKAYEWILAESLYAEWQDAGVDVTNIFVGATASENYLSFQETLDPANIAVYAKRATGEKFLINPNKVS